MDVHIVCVPLRFKLKLNRHRRGHPSRGAPSAFKARVPERGENDAR
jgi:hypothetical protein